jgi:hypothetical protein
MRKTDDPKRSAAPCSEVTAFENTEDAFAAVGASRTGSIFSIGSDGGADKSVIRFSLNHTEIGGARSFSAAVRVCQSPTCGCGFLTLDCLSLAGAVDTDDKLPLCLQVDVFDRVVKPKENSAADASELARAVAAELRDADWNLLLWQLHKMKRGQMETVDLATVDAWFPPEVTEDGAMARYGELFPWAEAWTFESDGERWMVGDEYCVQPGCDCVQVMLVFFRPRVGATTAEEDLPEGELDAFFNYKTGEIQLEKVWPGCPTQQLIAGLHTAYPGLNKELEKRHCQMQKLGRRLMGKRRSRFSNALRKFGEKLANDMAPDSAKAPAPVAGRNEPCPCGSGKKYKKCCMVADLQGGD